MGKYEDDEELAKEARELIAAANYPNDLNRYFDVLRGHGFEMSQAATYADNSERWEFLNNSGGQKSINVTIRFSRDSRSLDWVTILGLPSGEFRETTGQSVEQLEMQLKPVG
jgi:hypothetical protein